MGFFIPTLPQLLDRMRGAFRAEAPGLDANIWPNNVAITAKVIAGAMHEFFGWLDWVMRQMFASTAEGVYLERHAMEYGLARRPAAPASGIVTLTCTGAVSVAAGALFRSGGREYRVQSATSAPGSGTLAVSVVAGTDGAAGNAEAGTPLDIISGVTGTASAAVGAGGITAGVDVEDDESLRGRILFRKRNPPHGGSAADYVMWCMEVSGVTRVFVERLYAGPGTVRVFVLMDGLYENGIPPSGELLRVKAHLDMVAPSPAAYVVAAPTPVPVNVTVTDLVPDTSDVRVAVRAELADMLLRRGRVAGIDAEHPAMPYLASPFTLSRSWVWQSVSDAAGEASHVLSVPGDNTPFAPGEMPVLGALTFV